MDRLPIPAAPSASSSVTTLQPHPSTSRLPNQRIREEDEAAEGPHSAPLAGYQRAYLSSSTSGAHSRGGNASQSVSRLFSSTGASGSSRAGGGAGEGTLQAGMLRSVSSSGALGWNRSRQGEDGGLSISTAGRKASDASVYSAGTASRPDVWGAEDNVGSLSASRHARERSSATYLTYPSTSLSLTRTRSDASSSAASSEFPPTPANTEGAVVYRRRDSTASSISASLKGKEPEMGPSAWRSGVPMLSPPTSTRRAGMPAIIDPRFSFPMRRGGLNGSGSGGSGSGSGAAGSVNGRSRPLSASLNGQSRPVGLGLSGGTAADEPMRRRVRDADPATKGGGMSYIASLGSRDLFDSEGLPIPANSSYASPLLSPVWSDSTTSPSLAAFSPTQPYSPTSPVTSTFGSPVTPATALLPAFSWPKIESRSARSSKQPRPSFVARRRKSSFQPAPHRIENRRRSSASSSASVGSFRSSRSLHTRTTSLPNLRRAASGEEHPLPTFRRPSIPIPFDTFQPRPPRTRSPGHTTWYNDPLHSSAGPLVFPSKRPPPPPRLLLSSQRSQIPVTSHNIIPSGVCEALTFARPRVVVVPGSPTSSFHNEELYAKEAPSPRSTAREKGKGKARAAAVTWDQQSTGDEADASSVRRVLRENEASRLERAGWSDSATRALGYGLSTRLADRDRELKTAAVLQRRADRRKVRHEVQRRKRREAATGTESEYETDRGRGHPLSPGEAVPRSSPPLPSSFEPFSSLGRKLSFGKGRSRSGERRRSDAGASDGGGLGIVAALRHKTNASMSRDSSASGHPPLPSTPTVRGQPIRHLRAAKSVDSLYIRNSVAAGPIGRDLLCSSEVDTQYGEAVTVDEPSPRKGENRMRSIQSQNAFLSLPPHLHHLLLSPERQRYTPSRTAPPVPGFAPAANASTFTELLNKRDSTASNARLSSRLEEKLRLSQRNSMQSLEDLPVATSAPLAWRDRTEEDQKIESEQDFVEDAEDVSLDVPNERDLRTSGSFASMLTTSNDPLKLQSHAVPISPQRPSARGRRSNSSKMGKLSRRSSGSESALEMRVEGDYGGLFFSPPRPTGPLHQHHSSLDTTSSIEAPAPRPPSDLRIGDVPVSPVETQPRSHSTVSWIAMADSDAEEIDSDLEDYEARRERTARRSPEVEAISTSFASSGPSAYSTAAEPSTYATARTGPGFLSVIGARRSSADTRPSTALSTSYATADEGLSSDFSSDFPDIVFPFPNDNSPPSRRLPLPVASSPPVRPSATPAQTPFPATSWLRQNLTPSQVAPEEQAKRASVGSGSGSGASFLHLEDDEVAAEEEHSGAPQTSFMNFSSPATSTFDSPPVSAASTSHFPSDTPSPPQPRNVSRTSYLSVNSSHFLDPSSPLSANRHSAYSTDSRNSVLKSRLDDFPRPPGFNEEAGSDGDDEGEGRDDSDGELDPTIRLPSLRSTAPSQSSSHSSRRLSQASSAGPTESSQASFTESELGVRRFPRSVNLAAFPTVTERPLSASSFIDFDESGTEEAAAAVAKLTKSDSRMSTSSWKTFLSPSLGGSQQQEQQQQRPPLPVDKRESFRRHHPRTSSLDWSFSGSSEAGAAPQ